MSNGKDVVKKVETNLDQHQMFQESYEKAHTWISDVREIIQQCNPSDSRKEKMQENLNKIQVGTRCKETE